MEVQQTVAMGSANAGSQAPSAPQSPEGTTTTATLTQEGQRGTLDELCVRVEALMASRGEPASGSRYWVVLRAAWLRVPEEAVAKLPASFESPGHLQLSRSAQPSTVRDLSEDELEDLEDCLDAVQRPFPRLKRSVPLVQAVQCADALWDTDD
mmetsp:Transcript_25449/g.59255  ORF Transcript_25449/g.59255 Transcript_25449/m.59255 type:complete len:153 (+) Transcript_25449:145-603(+)